MSYDDFINPAVLESRNYSDFGFHFGPIPKNTTQKISGVNTLICDLALDSSNRMCGKSFQGNAGLYRHIRTFHPNHIKYSTKRSQIKMQERCVGENAIRWWVLSLGWQKARYCYEPRLDESSLVWRFATELEELARSNASFCATYGRSFHRQVSRQRANLTLQDRSTNAATPSTSQPSHTRQQSISASLCASQNVSLEDQENTPIQPPQILPQTITQPEQSNQHLSHQSSRILDTSTSRDSTQTDQASSSDILQSYPRAMLNIPSSYLSNPQFLNLMRQAVLDFEGSSHGQPSSTEVIVHEDQTLSSTDKEAIQEQPGTNLLSEQEVTFEEPAPPRNYVEPPPALVRAATKTQRNKATKSQRDKVSQACKQKDELHKVRKSGRIRKASERAQDK